MEVKVSINSTDAISKIAEAERKVPGANRYILKLICLDIINLSITEHLSGGIGNLRRKTGKLAQSLDYNVNGDWNAEVYSGLPYAAIHEFGGEIKPVFKKFLHWVTDDGDDVFTKGPVIMPARPYLRPAIDKEFNSGRAMQLAEKGLIDMLGGERT